MKGYHFSDVIVVGSGAAGLTLALNLARNCRVAILSKGPVTEGNTMYAQGGIAAVMADEDSIESHIADTINAGAGICDPVAVRFVAANARNAIAWLITNGVIFSKDDTAADGRQEYHLTREGGHSHRRILHAKDATGHEVECKLAKQVTNEAAVNPNIMIYEEHTAIDLIKHNNRISGVYVFNNITGKIEVFQAKFVVLATGGASKVYLYTSNPDCSSGDGLAMAQRAGCKIANMEFMQFHPTCLYHPQAKSFLISEALRGEGAKVILASGKRFLHNYDKRAELAPRDIVARAIDDQMKRLGLDCVYLDISHKPRKFIIDHFPTVYQTCLQFGFDITKSPIPIVPAAHYTCGGVVVNLQGQTNIEGLYAIGEVSCTGLHGANRMASNSLLECIVYAQSASNDIIEKLEHLSNPPLAKPWDESLVTNSDEEIVVTHNWAEIRHLMWDYVGIVRTNKRLARAKRRIELLKTEIQEYYGNFRVTKNLIELRNLVVVADLIINAAIARKENRGLHYNLDLI